MSAAAPARISKRELAPFEIEWEEFLKADGYTRRPNSFDQVEKAMTPLAAKLIWHIYRHTVGQLFGRTMRREWFALSEKAASRQGNASENGAAIALREAVESGAVEVRLNGRTNEYRVRLHNWRKLKAKPAKKCRPRVVAIDDADADAEASVMEPGARRAALTVAPGEARKIEVPAALANQVLVVLPGDKQPRLLADTCPHGRECELAKKVAIGALRLSRDGPHPVIPIRGTVAASGSEVLANPADFKLVTNPNTQLQLGGSVEFAAFLADVFTLVAHKIQAPPPEGLIERIYGSLNREGVDPDKFRARLNARRSKVHSWGMLDHLLEDVLGLARREKEARDAEEAAAAAQMRSTTRSAIRQYLDGIREIDGLKLILSKLHTLLHQLDEGAELDVVHDGWLSIDREMLDRLIELRSDEERREVEAQLAGWAKQGLTHDIAVRRVKRDALSRMLFEVGSLPEPYWE
ncbi:MAG: hypothetical protein IT163_09745 [Bryobacterales bacterium]|nr:hypothetical protein [Bryobacterales bacterium]